MLSLKKLQLPDILREARFFVIIVTEIDYLVVDRLLFTTFLGDTAYQFSWETQERAVRRIVHRVAGTIVSRSEIVSNREHSIGKTLFAITWFPNKWSIDDYPHLRGLVMISGEAAKVNPQHRKTLDSTVATARKQRESRRSEKAA